MTDPLTSASRVARAAVLSISLVVLPVLAFAQTAEEDSVQNRSRPDFDPIGIELDELLGVIGLVSDKTIEQKSSPLSSFVVKPSFGVTGVYESNIFLTENNAVADKRVEYQPNLVIQSDWGRHSLAMTVAGTIGRYVEATNENFEDYQVQLSGQLEIHDNKKLDAVIGFARRHQERDEEDDPGQGFEPTVSLNYFADLTFEYLADAFLFRPKFSYEYSDFLDSGTFDNDVQDVEIIDMSVRLGYEFSPGSTVFIEPNADFRLFAQARDASGFLQDNNSWGTLIGFTWDLTGVTFLEVAAGFTYREFDDPGFGSEFNFDHSVKGIWNATDVITVTAELGRSFQDSGTPGESGSLVDSGTLSLDYEFLDNVIISSGLALSVSTTDQSGRTDIDVGPSIGVQYFVNENWSAQLNLGYARRNSNFAGESHTNYSAGFGLVGKL